MQNTAIVKVYEYGYEQEDQEYPILSKEEMLKIHPKCLIKNRPKGISNMEDDKYVKFFNPNNGKNYAVKVSDFKSVLASCPHYPNKKESKEIRKAKIKKGK